MYENIVTAVATFFALVGAIIIFYGGLQAILRIVATGLRRKPLDYSGIRRDFTLKIVLALEFFIASDLIRGVLEPTLDRVVILAFIVGIRVVVGYSLNQELKGLPSGGE
jgi:uncharacterized membrane protein